MINKISIGKIIKKLRDEKHLTQEQLAEKIDISTNYLSRVERGINVLNAESFLKMAKILSFTLEDFGIGPEQSQVVNIQKEKLIAKILTTSDDKLEIYLKFITLIDESLIK